jgi:nitrate reductase alpha subunit
MSMVSYAAGARYLRSRRRLHVVLRLVLRPAAGLAADLGRADRRRRKRRLVQFRLLILWGSNVPQTRTPDAHFYTEARYKGAKSVVICPDYSEASKFSDLWLR